MIEMTILALQARILLLTGLAWLTVGIVLGYDPLTVAWRAAVGAVVVMLVAGVLLRIGARIMHQLAVSEMRAAEASAATEAEAANGA